MVKTLTPVSRRLDEAWREVLGHLAFFVLSCVYTELCLHLCVFHSFGGNIGYPLLFGALAGALCSLVTAFLPRRADRVVSAVLICTAVLLSEVQYVYHAIFGSFMQMSQVGMGGDVLANFGNQLLYGMSRNIPQILLLLLPAAAYVFLLVRAIKRERREKTAKPKLGLRHAAASAAAPLAVALALLLAVLGAGGKSSRIYSILNDATTSTGISYENIGMFATTVQELRFGSGADADATLGSVTIGVTQPEAKYPSDVYNVVEGLDFEELAESTDDETLRALDRYFATLEPSKKNGYTGLFKGYNLIEFCAESFSPVFIDEELTPALWTLTHGGFIFNNYYGTFQSVTTDGEYTTCMGLFPDLSRSKVNSSFDVSAGNYLPFCLGNALRAEGYETYAYHDYMGDFYSRNVTHPNMGYTFKAADSGLGIAVQWPSSDLEMMQVTMDEYLDSDKPFHAYYMTFSGHYQYNWHNAMSAKNRDAVADMPYSETVKAYIACNLELEYALEYTLERLEAAGKLDNTCIVLTNDHYPYGLSDAQFAEMAGEDLGGSLDKYRNLFVCYVPGMQVEVDAYCSTQDILPTVLNLMGVEYDSRLLAGTDVLSDSLHMAMLYNHSFVMDGIRYNAAAEEFTVTGELPAPADAPAPAEEGSAGEEGGGELPEPERADAAEQPQNALLEEYKQYVLNKFIMSVNILNNDYYSHALGAIRAKPSDEPHDVSLSVQFEDIDNVFFEASIGYMYRSGYVDAESEHVFGVSSPTVLGEYVDILYRMTGRPAFSEDALPEGYGGALFEYSKYRSAVTWAFQAGILDPGDEVTDFTAALDYITNARLNYRYAEYMAYDLTIDESVYKEMRGKFPEIDKEGLRAMVWNHAKSVMTPTRNLEVFIQNYYDGPLARQRCITYAHRLLTYEL